MDFMALIKRDDSISHVAATEGGLVVLGRGLA